MVNYVHCYYFSRLHPSFDSLKQDTTIRELALLPSSGENCILVGPIEGANPNSWTFT
jgi:hypothetical protein